VSVWVSDLQGNSDPINGKANDSVYTPYFNLYPLYMKAMNVVRDVDLDEVKTQLKKFTRRYAKRQMSWFRRDKRVKWIAIDKCNNVDSIVKILLRDIWTKIA